MAPNYRPARNDLTVVAVLRRSGTVPLRWAQRRRLLLAQCHLTRRVFAAVLRRILGAAISGVRVGLAGTKGWLEKKEGCWSVRVALTRIGYDAPVVLAGPRGDPALTSFFHVISEGFESGCLSA